MANDDSSGAQGIQAVLAAMLSMEKRIMDRMQAIEGRITAVEQSVQSAARVPTATDAEQVAASSTNANMPMDVEPQAPASQADAPTSTHSEVSLFSPQSIVQCES